METCKSINEQLKDLYGIDTITSLPMWRISWSDDQYEKRLVDCTPEGVQFVHARVMEVPKYPFIRERYVLERLVVVPEMSQREIPESKLSYEPVWVFRDSQGNYLPPMMLATKFVIDTVYAALGKKSLHNYVDPDSPENKEARIQGLQTELFGDDTEVSDALAYGEGIVVPSNYKKES